MKIGILIDEFVSGGAAVLAVQEALRLRDLGYKTEILSGTRFNEKTQAEQDKNIAVKFLVDFYPGYVKKLKFRFPFFSFFSPQHILSAFYAPKVIKSGDFDLIIAHGLFSALIAARLRRVRKIPFFTIFWDPSSYILPKVYSDTPLALFFALFLPVARAVDKWAARSPNRLILGSKFHYEWFNKVAFKKIDIVYPGCFPIEVLPTERGNYVLALDRWDKGSLPGILLEALHKSKHKFKLVIAGGWHDENLRKSFEKKVDEYGLKDSVEILGRISFDKVRELFLGARCFVHPTQEAFGMAVLEAAAFGCPIIIPARSGVTDLFVHGEDGFFPQDKDDVNLYCEYIDKFINDKAYAYKIGRNAWEKAKKYNWLYHAQRLDSIIKDYFKN